MGRSTTKQLITRGQAENAYNNSGISTNGQWIDFFNDALADLVDDLYLTKAITINFDPLVSARQYDLPDDFFSLELLNDANQCPVSKRRYYEQQYAPGYWILNNGDKYICDLYSYTAAQVFTGLYARYPTLLTLGGIDSEKPEVPTVAEKALPFYAIAKALRNNNQPGQAAEYDKHYEVERLKIRNAAARSRGG